MADERGGAGLVAPTVNSLNSPPVSGELGVDIEEGRQAGAADAV